MKSKIKIGIQGAAGYTGGELLRILLRHPQAEIRSVQSSSNAGNPVSSVHQDLVGETDLTFGPSLEKDLDVLFFCAGHGEAKKFLAGYVPDAATHLIDLSHDFRLKSTILPEHIAPFVYGLPELNREAIRGARNIANPGCFATAIQLGLLPLAKAGLLKDVYTTGITGSTGAGQSLSPTGHFSWRDNNIQAYKTLSHQHVGEIHQSLQQLQPSLTENPVHFVPWRGDFPRGIFISSQVKTGKSPEFLQQLYTDFYAGSAFTRITKTPVFMKQVVNTNKCLIQLEQVDDTLVVHSVIDNLTKGASGQAVQNMNLVFGLDECAGLNLKASYF